MDEELRRALRRVEPPQGFAERVLRSVGGPPSQLSAASARQAQTFVTASRWAIAATLVVATIAGGVWYRAEEKRKEGEEAGRQVMQSLNIAGSKLHAIAMKVNHGEER